MLKNWTTLCTSVVLVSAAEIISNATHIYLLLFYYYSCLEVEISGVLSLLSLSIFPGGFTQKLN